MMYVGHIQQALEGQQKPKRKRKPTDYGKLVLKNGRLTRAYWLLREGFVQDVRHDYIGTRQRGFNCWRTSRYIGALIREGYLQQVKGPRGGSVFRTTSEGAFAMLIAEGQHEAKKQNHRNNPT